MAVHAHPDDESSKGAATMAKYAAQGTDVLVATCTGGERGDVLNPKMDRPGVSENIATLRRLEMRRACAILGVRHRWLGFVDSGLPEGDPLPPLPKGCFARQDVERAAEPLVRLMREFRPHVVITYDEDGGYPHPDHIMTHKISVVAFDAAGDPERYPDAGHVWQPLKLFYHISARGQIVAQHRAMLAAGMESPIAEAIEELNTEASKDHRVTTRIECGDYFEVRDDALRAHTTQIDPDGPWFRVPLAIQQRVWPTEDYELVHSLVDNTAAQDDLFAGVHATVSV
jgi:mycothiol S-conjugate amidase